MGRQVLPPPATLDLPVVAVATVVHLTLSVLYATLVVLLVRGRTLAVLLAQAAVLGLALYAINMYLVTAIYPWFAQNRDWITASAHVAFAIAAALTWHCLKDRSDRSLQA